MMQKVLALLAVLLMIVGGAPASAQTEPPDTPVVRMLSHIPDIIEARSGLTYVDYDAIFAARPDMPTFSNWQEFDTAFNGERGSVVMAALNGVRSGPQFLQYLLQTEDTPEVMGFDFFEVDQAVQFGQPPSEVVIAQGDFDTTAVVTAHEARGFTKGETNGITLLCSEAGCENGREMDLQNRDPANLFGGALGRSQPTLVTETWIASSPTVGSVEMVAATDAQSSLAENPDYRSAVEALEANGTLLQSWFVQPAEIMPPSAMLAMGRLSDEQNKALEDEMKKEFVPIPAWNLAVLADVTTETDEQAVVALVYNDQADAEAAAAQFPNRLLNATSMMTMETFGSMFTERGMTSAEASVYPSTRDRYVVLVALHAPLPDNTPDADGRLVASSLLYSLLPQMYFNRDSSWLSPVF